MTSLLHINLWLTHTGAQGRGREELEIWVNVTAVLIAVLQL